MSLRICEYLQGFLPCFPGPVPPFQVVPWGICVKGVSSPDSRTPVISTIPHCGIREGPLLCMKLQHTSPTRCLEGSD